MIDMVAVLVREIKWTVKKTGALLDFVEKEYPAGEWTKMKFKVLVDFYCEMGGLVDSK